MVVIHFVAEASRCPARRRLATRTSARKRPEAAAVPDDPNELARCRQQNRAVRAAAPRRMRAGARRGRGAAGADPFETRCCAPLLRVTLRDAVLRTAPQGEDRV